MAKQTISGCYAPPDILDNTQRPGWATPGGKFGSMVENPIFTDYVVETHGSWFAAAVANRATRIDWGDGGSKVSYINELLHHHPNLDREELEKDKFRWPDILTTGGPVRLAGGVLLHSRNEYYEIKPDSPTGRRAGREKKRDIEEFFDRHGLKSGGSSFYLQGATYPKALAKRFRLPGNALFQHALRVIMLRHGFTDVRLYIQVKQLEPGLLVYRVCIEVDQDTSMSKREKEDAAAGLAKFFYAWWLVCHVPGLYASFKKVEIDHSYRGDPLPRIRCQFETVPSLRPWYSRIERNMFARGIGYPGEQFIVACDEGIYRRLVPVAPSVTVAEYWRRVATSAKWMVSAIAGEGAWNLVEPVMLSAKDISLDRFNLMFPDMENFVNTLLAWMESNPEYTIAIVFGAVVVTAAVAAFWEVALLPAIEEAVEAGIGVIAGPTSGLGRVALTETQEAAVYANEETLLRTIGARPGVLDPAEIARISLGATAAGNNVSTVGKLISAPFVKRVAVGTAAAGFAMIIHTTEAYASQSSSSSSNTTGPSAKQTPIASHADRLYIAPSVPWPPPTKRPIPGERADISQHIQNSDPLSMNHNPESPPPLIARYLGHLTVT